MTSLKKKFLDNFLVVMTSEIKIHRVVREQLDGKLDWKITPIFSMFSNNREIIQKQIEEVLDEVF